LTKNNVSTLSVAWTWKTGEQELKQFGTHPGSNENKAFITLVKTVAETVAGTCLDRFGRMGSAY